MSVENFDGDGLADQPSIIYSFETDNFGDVEIRELARSGFGEVGPSPGDVIERETTTSDPTDSLPELELPGQDGLTREDCGENIPAFACLGHDSADSAGCGKPVYVGRTCANPTCERDWPAAVKRKIVRTAGKLEGFRRALYARNNGRKDIDFNHVVASPPDGFAVDSETPLKRTLLILKTLLEKHWGIEGFVAIFHPYRIKKEYRKDQYEHGGAEGEGDMTWKDVLDEGNPYQYLTFEPHFHLFFPAPRASFDYSVAEAIEAQSGWLFHRITKGGEDNNVSVEDLDDLVHQLTYCFSHAGVREVGPRDELASRMKGDLHNCYIPDGVEEEVLAMFCNAAPKLLGVRFANMNEATCSAEISQNGLGSDESESPDRADTCHDECGCDSDQRRHPLHDVWNPDLGADAPSTSSGGNPWPGDEFDAGSGGTSSHEDMWASPSVGSSSTQSKTKDSSAASVAATTEDSDPSPEAVDEGDTPSDEPAPPAVDARSECGGTLRPIYEAEERLEDDSWCKQAEYVSGLRDAYAEWEDLVDDEQEKPWVDVDDDDDDLDAAGSVVRTD